MKYFRKLLFPTTFYPNTIRHFFLLLASLAISLEWKGEALAIGNCITETPSIVSIKIIAGEASTSRTLGDNSLLLGTGSTDMSHGKVTFLGGSDTEEATASIQVKTSPKYVGSVSFHLNGLIYTINSDPTSALYTLPKSELKLGMKVGLNELEVTPYQCTGASGQRGIGKNVRFSYIRSNQLDDLSTSSTTPRIKKFVLVDRSQPTASRFRDLNNRDVVPLDDTDWAIAVVTSPTVVGSVRYEVDNELVAPGTDRAVNSYPYILPADLSPGAHEITAIPYPLPDRHGVQGEGETIRINIVDPNQKFGYWPEEADAPRFCTEVVPSIVKIEVIGARAGAMGQLNNCGLIVGNGSLEPAPKNVLFLNGDGQNLEPAYIRVITQPPFIGSVRFELNNQYFTSNATPYYLPRTIPKEADQQSSVTDSDIAFSEIDNALPVNEPEHRKYELEVTPYQCTNRRGLRGESKKVSIAYIENDQTDYLNASCEPPIVRKFVLFDMSSGSYPTRYRDLKDGDTIQMGTRTLGIGVVTKPSVVGSVRYELDNELIAPQGHNAVNAYPYILPVEIGYGTHELEAKPYPLPNRSGIQGQGLKVRFAVVAK